MIDIGTKAKVLFSAVDFLHTERQQQFRKECLLFYVIAVKYLQNLLPFDFTLIRQAQYLHPEKRSDVNATSGISNLALKFNYVLKNCLLTVFLVKLCTSREEIVDLIRNQWILYRNEIVPQNFYLSEDIGTSNTSVKNRYLIGIMPMMFVK